MSINTAQISTSSLIHYTTHHNYQRSPSTFGKSFSFVNTFLNFMQHYELLLLALGIYINNFYTIFFFEKNLQINV